MTDNKKKLLLLQGFTRLLVALAANLFLAASSHADFVSLTGAETSANIAEIDITERKLHISLEVSAADANSFWPGILETDDIQTLAKAAANRKSIALRVKAKTGTIFPSSYSVRVAERKPRISPFAGKTDPRTGLKLPSLPTDKLILLVDLQYPIEGFRHLELRPPMNAEGLTTATIGFIARHGNTPISSFNYLSQPEQITIDWQDPWNTRFENPNISRHNRYPLMTFLYVEPRQVRHEILLRPKDLQQWTDQPFDAWQPLTAQTRQRLRTAALNYLKEKNPTSIDEGRVHPGEVQALFLRATNSGFSVVGENEEIELGSVLIAYRQRYPIDNLPQSVEIGWELFSDMSETVPTLIQDPAGPFPTHVVRSLPRIEWRNFITNYRAPLSSPVVYSPRSARVLVFVLSIFGVVLLWALLFRRLRYRTNRTCALLLCGIASVGLLWNLQSLAGKLRISIPALVEKKELAQVTETLLIRLSAAFEEPEPSDLERRLANLIADADFNATAENLAQIYRQPTTGGGSGRIKSVNNLKIEHLDHFTIDGQASFRLICSWQALVEGQHWGHIDRKLQQVRADIDIIQVQDQWKIAAFTPLTIR